MDSEQFDEINKAINARSGGGWESKMASYYQARYDGIRRMNKPYRNAPDMHYPLIDTTIEKLKPFYAQQIYADQVLATFVAQDPVPQDQVVCLEGWNDYKVKECSNFEQEIMYGVDTKLHFGMCPLKIYWDGKRNRLSFEAKDPLYVIVPRNSPADVQEVDWLVDVKVMTRAAYERNQNYKQGKDFVDGIVGRGYAGTSSVVTLKEQEKAQREGLTYTNDNRMIVIWEVYTRKDDGWLVTTTAPVKGPDGDVRKPFMLAYRNGENGETLLPFVVLRNEVAKGWYASRGIAEILMAHEMALNKNWNSQLQFLDFFGHPQYKNMGLAPINQGSFQGRPGSILPQGVEPIIPTSAPVDFQLQMQFLRALSEDRIQIPDLSSGEHLTGPRRQNGEITATQVNAVVQLSNQGNDLRARLFRLQLGQIYNQAFGLLKQFDSQNLTYFDDGQMMELPADVLDSKYTIHPSGSADSWNKAYRIQKATMQYQMLKGAPNVNQDESLKKYLEADDPRDIKRLFQSSNVGSTLQGEKQAMELLMMEAGHPAMVKPDDMDGVHLLNIGQWLQYKMQQGTPPDAATAGRVMQHAMGHIQAASTKQDKQAMAIAKQARPGLEVLQQLIASGQPAQPQVAGGMGAPGAQPPGAGQGGTVPSQSINYKDAPDSIKRQMEIREGYQPAVAQPTPDQEKLAVKSQSETQAAQPPGPSPEEQKMALAAQDHAMKLRHAEEAHQQKLRHQEEANALKAKAQAQADEEPSIQVQKGEDGHTVKFKQPKPAKIPAPVVNVAPPQVTVHPPAVHVAPPAVNVPAPVVHVPAPIVHVPKQDKPKRIKVVRDKEGKISHAEIE